ncbi:hypothetical protein F7Q99_38490 [Streptomyces kaniharaensis]|uniref:Uncharacterized protein n=1 Tax=Streptomyces kaniharaensis TaxID=212423 RepID=A0A6N7L3T9_9ACTN|nr:hypothetical protein [Streptomyces kaniharaensis]MQS17925.1 hypothetical protein [Streptomyces kaniharaensis]
MRAGDNPGMGHVPDHVVRTLWYIDALARRGRILTEAEVEAFARTTPPRDTAWSTFELLPDLFGSGPMRRPGPTLDYLKKVGWATVKDSEVTLTSLGRQVLAACDTEADAGTDSDITDVALDPKDSLVYVTLTRRLALAGAGLLVDPYFKAESLALIATTTLARILITASKPNAKTAEKEHAAIAVALASVPNASDIEVRASGDSSLHDRCIIGADQRVQLLGSSVNGVGKHLTAVISPPEDIAHAYRQKYEKLWDSAQRIEPQSVRTAPATDDVGKSAARS